MLQNYFKVMLRNLLKNKTFTLINLLGLATGMAVCLLILLYIQNELGYDDFHERGDDIFRVALERKYPGRSAMMGTIPQSIGQAIKKEFPEVLESTRVLTFDGNGAKIAIGDKLFTDKNVLVADSNFFRVFTGHFLLGDPTGALQKPGTAVLNKSTAIRYFGSVEGAIGQKMILDDYTTAIVTGVIADWPEKSHLQFDILLTTSGDNYLNNPQYVYFGPYCYLLLSKTASPTALQAKLPAIVDKYVAPTIGPLFGESWKQFTAEGNGYNYFLQPLKRIHLYSALENELRPTGSMSVIRVLAAIGCFILLLACVNFVNLSTALSVERAREVGIRKTFGSQKSELVRQFLSESLVFSTASILVAFLLTLLFTPLLNKVAGKQLDFGYFLQPLHLLSIIGFSLLVGIVAGLYPAFVLSSFDPMQVLKGRFRSSGKGRTLRNGLVVFQFAISVILIICTLVVNRQMQYMLGDRLGFTKDHVITLDRLFWLRHASTGNQSTAFINDIGRIAGVEQVALCTDLPGSDNSGGGATWVTMDNTQSRTQKMINVGEEYLSVLGLQLQQGRFFSREMTTDSLGVVLNESAVKDFGFTNPIGKRIVCKEPFLNPADGKSQNVFTVIGVVKDYHFQSLHKKIAPMIMVNANKFGWGSAAVRIQSDHFKTAIAAIQAAWTGYDRKHDLQFNFLDQVVAAQYAAEQTEQKLFTIFSVLAIGIACVGLLGLSAYAVRQRTKEISVRKVLGAMPGSIVLILSKDFLIPIGAAVLIAFPIAWWAMDRWLQDFAYRIELSWWIFALAAAIVLTLALLTTSFQALKAALANPIKSLRSE